MADGTVLGHLSATDPSEVDTSSTTRRKRTLATRSTDVILHFVAGTGTGNGSLLAQNALYSPPYIGQSNATLSGQILFTNVEEGGLSTMWNLNETSGVLSGMSCPHSTINSQLTISWLLQPNGPTLTAASPTPSFSTRRLRISLCSRMWR